MTDYMYMYMYSLLGQLGACYCNVHRVGNIHEHEGIYIYIETAVV